MDMVTLDAREPGTAPSGIIAASERFGFDPDAVDWEYSFAGSEDDEEEEEDEDEDDEDDDEGEDENEGEGQ